jgi:hypothetical protein
MIFRVGQKVVCVGEVIPDPSCAFPIFQKGAVYTVSLIEEFGGFTFLTVAELHPCVTGEASGFRPIVERKTDISFAHEILRKASRKGRVRA